MKRQNTKIKFVDSKPMDVAVTVELNGFSNLKEIPDFIYATAAEMKPFTVITYLDEARCREIVLKSRLEYVPAYWSIPQ